MRNKSQPINATVLLLMSNHQLRSGCKPCKKFDISQPYPPKSINFKEAGIYNILHSTYTYLIGLSCLGGDVGDPHLLGSGTPHQGRGGDSCRWSRFQGQHGI